MTYDVRYQFLNGAEHQVITYRQDGKFVGRSIHIWQGTRTNDVASASAGYKRIERPR